MTWNIRHLSKYALPALLFIAAFAFWRFLYPQALAYQEQFQLFLFDTDYLLGRLAVPGGVARWTAEALTQFDNNVTAGALIMALLYVILRQLTWRVMRREGAPAESLFWQAASLVPVLLLWFMQGDVNVMPMYTVALILALSAMCLLPEGKVTGWVYVIVICPLLYWAAGPVTFAFGVYLLLRRPLQGIVALVWTAACVILSYLWVPYPLSHLFHGIGYYRYPEVVSYVMAGLTLLCGVLPRLSKIAVKPGKTDWLGLAVVVLAGLILVPMGYEKKTYELMDYDYLVRRQQWNKVIAKAEREQPDLPMSVCATDLALGMTGQLGDRAFDFYQNGVEGLLPAFKKNFVSQLITSEAYFHLGLVNTAQRFSFEAMECIPDNNKSARVVKRLAETNLINGQYGVARKYLDMLEKTVFYRKWAQRTKRLLGDEAAINAHPLYGKMRQNRLQTDFLFSEREVDKVIGQLFLQNPENDLAKQYLLVCPLLQRNIPKFMNYLSIIENKTRYFPLAAQQGIIFAYMQQKQQPPKGTVSPMVTQTYQRFVQTYSMGGINSQQMEDFRYTLWYYLLSGVPAGKEGQS